MRALDFTKPGSWVPASIPVPSSLQEVSSPQYLSLSAQDKGNRLWTNCELDTSSADWLGGLEQGLGLMGENTAECYCTMHLTNNKTNI